ncbi:hypothetical protein VR41_03330 [Streptomyces sp. NRRL B-1568]|nr:hypothetical protein VR41_03330 [Streptomyces sp. NRRL B-1568]
MAALVAYFFTMHAYVFLWKSDNFQLQRRLDRDSEEKLRSVIQGQLGGRQRYVLYLRPFLSTTQLPSGPLHGDMTMKPAQHIDMELIFRRAFKRNRLFVALGKPGEAEGAARFLTSEKNWWNTFVKLAKEAEMIVLLPSAREGTFREAQWISQNGMLGKCLIFMPAIPPTSGGFDIYEGPKLPIVRVHYEKAYSFNPAKEWKEAADKFRGIDIELPEYDPRGALIRLAGDSSVDSIVFLNLHKYARRARRVREAVRDPHNG